MKLKKVLPITAMLLIALVSGCNKDVGTSSDLMSSSDLKAGAVPVNLRTAGNYVILAESAITTTGVTAITGDLGISPNALSDMTGFGPVLDATGLFALSNPLTLVTGKIYAADMGGTTSTNLTTAVGDMGTAYTDAAARITSLPAATYLNLGEGTIGASTPRLAPGVYTWTSPGTLNITGDITLNGSSTSVWIFQVNGTLDMASAASIILTGGAKASNIFWQVTGAVTLGTDSHFEGTILAQTNVAMQTGASLNGRALAQTAVTLDANAVTIPAFVPVKGAKSIKVGPIRVTGAEDIGSCNNVWAIDAFEMVYTITANGYGTYNVNVKYNHGTFVTLYGKSPGACATGDGSNMVADGIKGTMVQEYNGTVTGTLIPGVKYTGGFVTDTKTTTFSILNTLFGSGAWSWTILPGGDHWTWKATYKAGKHGTYFDTSTSWPLNNTGDIQ